MERGVAWQIDVVEVEIVFDTKIEGVHSFEDGSEMEGILAFAVTDVEVTTELLENSENFRLVFEDGILGGGTVERVAIIEEHGVFVGILFEKLSCGWDVILT